MILIAAAGVVSSGPSPCCVELITMLTEPPCGMPRGMVQAGGVMWRLVYRGGISGKDVGGVWVG